MICDQCNKEFSEVLEKIETVVKGDIVRIKNDLNNPCCSECLQNAFVELCEAISSL